MTRMLWQATIFYAQVWAALASTMYRHQSHEYCQGQDEPHVHKDQLLPNSASSVNETFGQVSCFCQLNAWDKVELPRNTTLLCPKRNPVVSSLQKQKLLTMSTSGMPIQANCWVVTKDWGMQKVIFVQMYCDQHWHTSVQMYCEQCWHMQKAVAAITREQWSPF